MKVPFDKLFHKTLNGFFAPKGLVRIHGATIGPSDFLKEGVQDHHGVDIRELVGRVLEVEQSPDGAMVIIRVHDRESPFNSE